MFGSKILDVAIGLIFVYIIVSVLCTAIREGIEAWMKTRAAYLEHGIRVLLNDYTGTGAAKKVFEHPLIFGLFTSRQYTPGADTEKPSPFRRGDGLPSYIPSKTFATALMDIAAHGPGEDASTDPNAPPISLDAIRRNVSSIGNADVQRVLLTAVNTAQGDIDKAQKAIEDWYDASMDRVSGWYKRSTQNILLAIGLLIAVGMNIDSVAIVNELYKTEATREAVVAAAGSAKEKLSNTDAKQSYEAAKNALAGLDLPVGWSRFTMTFRCPPNGLVWFKTFLVPWLGWLLTAVAATLGAPFWFDVLNKVMVIRSTVKPHEKSPEEASEDRQSPPPATTVVVNPTAGTPAGGGAPPPPPPPNGGGSDDVDGCDAVPAAAADPTGDAQLPAAAGGVA